MDFTSDQLNIETPEQVDLRFPLAGVGSRFVAVLLDTILQVGIYVVLGLVIYVTSAYKTLDGVAGGSRAEKWLIALFVLANFVLFWGYFVLFETYWKGQTPGKRVMKLRVLKDSGRSITLFEAMARNLLRIVDALPNAYVVGLITMLCNKQNKRLGDYVAGTIVVHERVAEQPFMAGADAGAQGLMPEARQQWAAGAEAMPADAVARLGPEDLHVIEAFFGRALDLPVAKREELGERLAARMSEKMGLTRPVGMRAEAMLELIAWRMRGVGR